MTDSRKIDNYIKKKSIITIGYSSLAFLFLLVGFYIVDKLLGEEIEIINTSVGNWFFFAIVSFIVSLIVTLFLFILIMLEKKVHKIFLYLFTFPILFFIFSTVNCSGGLYSPFLSLYALIFTGAIIITDSRWAIGFMITLVILGIFLHLNFNTHININTNSYTDSKGLAQIKDCTTLLNDEIYQIKYAIILGIVFLEMMLAEFFNKNKANKQKEVIEDNQQYDTNT